MLVNGYIYQIGHKLGLSDDIIYNNYIFKYIKYLILEYLYFTMNLLTKQYGSFDEIYTNPSMLDMIGSDGSNYWYYISTKNVEQQFCIKRFQKIHARQDAIYHCESEINILSKLDHPNIINLKDIFEDKKELCLIYEYCAGIDLYETIDDGYPLNEFEAKIIFKQILNGLKYLHKHKIVHLNIKPESIWFKYGEKRNNIDYKLRMKSRSFTKQPKSAPVYNTDGNNKSINAGMYANAAKYQNHVSLTELPSLPSLSIRKSVDPDEIGLKYNENKSNHDRNGKNKKIKHKYELCIFNFEKAQKLSAINKIQKNLNGTKQKPQPRLSLYSGSSNDDEIENDINNYSAPELLQILKNRNNDIINYEYSASCDIWSAGCILYYILCGYPPFEELNIDDSDSETDNIDAKQLKNGQYFFSTQEWINLSENAKDLISKLLQQRPNERLTAKQALKHPFFTSSV